MSPYDPRIDGLQAEIRRLNDEYGWLAAKLAENGRAIDTNARQWAAAKRELDALLEQQREQRRQRESGREAS